MRFKKLFNEALSLKVAKKFSKDWNREHYDHWFGKNVYRLYFNHSSGDFLDESPNKKIEKVLNANGYEIENWESGLAKKKGTDKNFIKIGKLLQRLDPDLKKNFDLMKDKTSKILNASDDDLMIVISRHPYDIAGMSTDRDWKSCTELDKKTGKIKTSHGENIEKYIKNNALIAYLIKSDDKNINAPIGRIIIYPYTNTKDEKNQVLVLADEGYGKTTDNMRKIIQKWLDQKQGKKFGSFKANFYTDRNQKEINLADMSKYDDIRKNPNKYGIKQLKNIENLERHAEHKWFFDGLLDGTIKIKNATIIDQKTGNLIWESGTWENGVWKDGIWWEGIWKNGTWKSGMWHDGIWEKGTWKSGTWQSGIWQSGEWKDGTWESGEWKSGTWESGVWNRGIWRGGVWKDGIWWDGMWENGTWFNGIWEKGTWKSGTWKSGTWIDGIWWEGTWIDGIWWEGIWKNGRDKNGNEHTTAPNEW